MSLVVFIKLRNKKEFLQETSVKMISRFCTDCFWHSFC